jgi:hypothetical protein
MITSISKQERIRIMDKLIHEGIRAIDRSSAAKEFYDYWFLQNNISDESKKVEKFLIRKLPDLPDFALAFFKKLCERNNCPFADNGRFSEDDYPVDDNDKLIWINAKRTIELDVQYLRSKLLENNSDELVKDIHAYGYYYSSGLGLGISSIERKDLKHIFNQVDNMVRMAKILNDPDLNKSIEAIQNFRSSLVTYNVDEFIMYEKEHGSDSRYFNHLFNLISSGGSCEITRIDNENNRINVNCFPLFLRQTNNRWYLLYLDVSMLDDATQKLKTKNKELLYDLYSMCPMDQINAVIDTPNRLPKILKGTALNFFDHVFGVRRPRTVDKKTPEKVTFKIESKDIFLIRRFKYEKMFPGLILNKSDNKYHYYDAEFYITKDAVNKVMSYIHILEVTKGKTLKNEILERVKNIKSLK